MNESLEAKVIPRLGLARFCAHSLLSLEDEVNLS